jgi:hypothetical protein
MANAGSAQLEYIDDTGSEGAFALSGEGPLTIGRGDDADLSLPWDFRVSVVHAGPHAPVSIG